MKKRSFILVLLLAAGLLLAGACEDDKSPCAEADDMCEDCNDDSSSVENCKDSVDACRSLPGLGGTRDSCCESLIDAMDSSCD